MDNNFSLCKDVNWIFYSIFTPVRKFVNLLYLKHIVFLILFKCLSILNQCTLSENPTHIQLQSNFYLIESCLIKVLFTKGKKG